MKSLHTIARTLPPLHYEFFAVFALTGKNCPKGEARRRLPNPAIKEVKHGLVWRQYINGRLVTLGDLRDCDGSKESWTRVMVFRRSEWPVREIMNRFSMDNYYSGAGGYYTDDAYITKQGSRILYTQRRGYDV